MNVKTKADLYALAFKKGVKITDPNGKVINSSRQKKSPTPAGTDRRDDGQEQMK